MTIGEIRTDVDFLCGSSSATYSATDKTRNINIAYQDVARVIWESAGGWQYDDSNATTLPVAMTSLMHTQQDYELPSTAQRVHRVEIMDSAGNWVKLSPLDQSDVSIAMPEFLGGSAGMPIYYDLVGRSILLYPAPSSGYATLASGMAVYVDRDVTPFTTSATTTLPGFATAFHRLLSYAAAIDFDQNSEHRNFLVKQRDRMEKGLTRFYAKRGEELKTTIKPAGKKRWRQYL